MGIRVNYLKKTTDINCTKKDTILERVVRKGAGAIYNPSNIVAVYSVALGPVVSRDKFYREDKSRNRRHSKGEKLYKGVPKKKKDERFEEFIDIHPRTIDLIA